MLLNLPKITIITVVRNGAPELGKTIRSVLAQDYPHLEFILIDGGSTDGTIDVIRENATHITYWSSEPDRGIYDAMNKGLVKATGEWVNFMNAGDTFAGKDAISKVMTGALDGYAVIYGDSVAAYSNGNVFKKSGSPEQMIKGMAFCHQAAFLRRELIPKEGFDLSFPIGADFKVFFGLYSQGYRFKHLSFPVAVFDTNGTSNLKMVQSAREHYTVVKMYHKLSGSERFHHYRFICWVSLVSLGYKVLPGRVVCWLRGMING